MSFGGGTEVGSIRAVIGLDASALKRGIADAQSALSGLSSSAQSSLSQMGSAAGSTLDAFEKAAAGIAGAFTLISGAAMKASADVSSAFNQIRVATGATGPQLDALQASFEKIGGSVPNNLGDVGKALATLSQRTGLTGKSLEDLATQELNLSTITGTDVAESVRLTTRVFGDWGIASDKQAATLDSLFRASQKTGISVGDLSRQIVYYGAPLRELGIGFDQASALIGKFENEGVNAKLVLGALRVELTRSAKGGVTDLAKGFEQAANAIKNASTTAQANKIAGAVFGALRGPDMAAAIREGRLETDALVKSIAGSHDTINRATADTMTFSKGFATLRNSVELALAPLGKGVGNSLAELGNNLKPALSLVHGLGSAFGALPGPVIAGTVAFAALTPLLGPQLAAIIGGAVGLIDTLLGAWKNDFGGIRSATEKFMDWVSPAVLYGFEQLTAAAKEIWNDFAAFLGGFWDGLKQTVIEPAAAFGKSIVEAIAGPFASFGKLLDRLPAGVKNAIAPLRDLAAALNPDQIALEIDAMGTAYKIEHPEYGQTPAGGGGNKPRPHGGGGGGGGDGAGGGWWDKKTEAQKEDESAQKRIAANARVLAFLQKGESVDVAKLAGEYRLLSAGRLQEVVASQKQVDSAVQAAESRKAYLKDLPKVEAEIRRLKEGHDAEAGGLDALKEKYPGLSSAMLAHMFQVQQYEKRLNALHEAQKAVNEVIRGTATAFAESTAQTRYGREALSLYAAAWKDYQGKQGVDNATPGGFWGTLTPEQQLRAKQQTTTQGITGLNNQVTASQEALTAMVSPSGFIRSRSDALLQQQLGPNWNDYATHRQTVAANTAAEQIVANQRGQRQAGAAQSIIWGQGEKEDQLTGSVGPNTELLAQQLQALTGKSTLARETMEKFGVVLTHLPKETQAAVKGFFEMEKSLKFVQDFASGVEGVFQGMFSNLFQHGFKGFFSSVVQGFNQMLQKMAADYLSSQLANGLMNLLGGVLGSAFGGGGAPSAASLADDSAAMGIPGHAMGGSYSGGQPFWAGERGPELVFPHGGGTVIPHAQSMAMAGGGGPINITMHINGVSDAASFQAPQNRHAITETMARELQRANARRR